MENKEFTFRYGSATINVRARDEREARSKIGNLTGQLVVLIKVGTVN